MKEELTLIAMLVMGGNTFMALISATWLFQIGAKGGATMAIITMSLGALTYGIWHKSHSSADE